jgi:hypothetical protein
MYRREEYLLSKNQKCKFELFIQITQKLDEEREGHETNVLEKGYIFKENIFSNFIL